MSLELGILGALEVRSDGHTIELRSAKQRALLAVLLLHAGEVVPRDLLLDALWGETPPPTAAKALQVHVSQLRKARVLLETRPPGYLLRVDDDSLDARRFERLAREGSAALAAGHPQRASNLLHEALALWRGPALADLAYAEFAQPEIARLEALRLEVLEDRIEADLALGRDGAVGELEALITREPFRERLRAQLMRALYREGRQAEALAAYREARDALVEGLGIEPSPELRELERAILDQDPALSAAATTPRESDDFVGRDAELQLLLGKLDDAISGRGSLVLVAGEAGIGKSRLAEELTTRAAARGVRVLTGRCWEAGGAPPYWPWTDALHEDGGRVSDVAALLPVAVTPDDGDPDTARFRLFDAVASFLRAAASDQPVLVVLDDVHAADAPSLLLLRFLADRLDDVRLLVVALYRDDEVGADHALAPAELLRSRSAARVVLRGLARADVERFLVAHDVTDDVAARIHTATNGNPLFVAELTRLLQAEGEWGERLPDGVREAIGRRLQRLTPDCRELLVAASVLGRELRPATVMRLTGASRDEMLDAIDEAVAAHLLEEAAGTLRFTHALVRDAMYEELSPARRERWHRRAGATLEALYAADPDPHFGELAHHFCAAADPETAERAIAYARRAGDRAAGQLAYEEAARLYALALSVLEREATGDAEGHVRLLLQLGDAQMRGGEGADARATFLKAARIAERAGLAELLGEAALAYIGRFVWLRAASDANLVPLIERALAALGGAEHPLRAKLEIRLVVASRAELARDVRARVADEAVELARRVGDPATLAYVLDARCSALMGPAGLAQNVADAEEIIALATQLGDVERLFAGHEHRFWVRMRAGDLPRAMADREAMRRISHELRQPAQRWLVALMDATVANFHGRFAEGERLIEAAFRLGEHAQTYSPGIVRDIQLYALRAEQGRRAELDADLAQWVGRSGQHIFDCMQAAHDAHLGRGEKAAERLAQIAADDFAGIAQDEQWAWGAALLAETCAMLGDGEHGASMYELLLPHEGQVISCIAEVAAGAASRWLGILAVLLEHRDDAARHFEDALELDTRLDARPAVAHDLHEHGLLLLRDDRTRAHDLLQQAAERYDELGMGPWAAQARVAGGVAP